ncbi:unnamed protein product [Spirodela intermedia]|uniref:Protein kinase domain-containing protein n=1 Tax=Spirodela intermedia TaxID=51605 RepID=A0A7I8JYZ3_SPIIN|nr:unnamed protein product [Spirodela intermedia]
MKEFEYGEIESGTGGFAAGMVIGKGSHGRVYSGVLRGGRRVAVKVPPPGDGGTKLNNEIEVLASVRGPHLVNLVGVSRSPAHGCKLLVMEFMPNGSLYGLLHAAAAPPPWRRRALVALQIATAVRSLHEATPPVIHRDVKSGNILFDAAWNARLADFSLAVRWAPCAAGAVGAQPAGTIGYMDPCYTGPGKLGPENDVFSFGVVLLELISCRLAMDAACGLTSIVAWALPLIRDGRLLEICDSRVPLSHNMERAVGRLLGIAARCVSSDQDGRPSMAEVVAELQGVVERALCPGRRLLRLLLSGRMRTKKIMCRNHQVDAECEKLPIAGSSADPIPVEPGRG